MDALNSIVGATGPSGTSSPSSSSAVGQDTFLKLLTTQMQNQDPLNPLSNEEFVAQLAQFSSLEQLMGIQGSLDAVYMGIASMNNASMANLIGNEVIAAGDRFKVDGAGPIELAYDADADATSARLTVYGPEGNVVYSGDLGALAAGEGTVTWDGHTNSGAQAADGEYTFAITATDGNGDTVEVTEQIRGTITEMDYSSGTPEPSVDGVTITVADILRVTAAE